MKFSVIIPTYNREKTICRAIDSVINQNYEDVEIIVVDDCSTDGSYKRLSEYINNEIIRYVRLENNGGVLKARNTGFNLISSDSDYVILLDSDDAFMSDAFKLIIKKISENKNIIHFFFSMNYSNGEPATFLSSDNMIGSYDICIGKCTENKVDGEAAHVFQSSFIRNSFRFNSDINGFEWISWLNCYAIDGYKSLYVKDVIIEVFTDEPSILRTKNKNRSFYRNMLKGTSVLLEKYGDDLKVANKKKYSRYLSCQALSMIKLGYKRKGFLLTLEAIKASPLELRNFRNMIYLIF